MSIREKLSQFLKRKEEKKGTESNEKSASKQTRECESEGEMCFNTSELTAVTNNTRPTAFTGPAQQVFEWGGGGGDGLKGKQVR